MARMTREDLIWIMAKAAHDAHYCIYLGIPPDKPGPFGDLCQGCREDGQCMELSNSFTNDHADHGEWYRSAENALVALEGQTGISFGVKQT